MHLLSRAKETVFQSVGLADRPPSDESYAKYYTKLETMDGIVKKLRLGLKTFADAMFAMSEANRALTSDITDFYKKSADRQKVVEQYAAIQQEHESCVVFLYKEQFGWDVLKELDAWSDQSHTLKERLRVADQQRQSVASAKKRVDAAKASGKSADDLVCLYLYLTIYLTYLLYMYTILTTFHSHLYYYAVDMMI